MQGTVSTIAVVTYSFTSGPEVSLRQLYPTQVQAAIICNKNYAATATMESISNSKFLSVYMQQVSFDHEHWTFGTQLVKPIL